GRLSLVHPTDLQRPQCAALLALDVKLDRAAADLAVLDIRRLIRSEVDARVQALAAIWATHRNELLGRHPPALRRLPYRLETIELIDIRIVETRDALPETLQRGCFALAFDHLRRSVATAMLRPVPGQRGYVKMSIVRAAAIVLWGTTVVLGGCGTTNL